MNNAVQRKTRSRTVRPHDENAVEPRLTRARAAATGVKTTISTTSTSDLGTKKANSASLQSVHPVSRKRAALGDLSNNPNKDALKNGKSLVSVKTTAAATSNNAPSLTSASSNKSSLVRGRPLTLPANRQPTLAPSARVSAATQLRDVRARHLTASKQASQIEESAKPIVTKKVTRSGTSALPIPVYNNSKQESSKLSASSLNNANTALSNNNEAGGLLRTVKTNKAHKLDSEVENERPAKKLKRDEEVAQGWDDLDAEDMDDPLMVSEYAPEIFEYMYKLQKDYMPNPNYMEDQKCLEWEYRGVLVDWLVEVHQKFRLLPETLFLAVNIIDRFMSVRVVSLPKVQLVGIASLLIAAKFEEVFVPAVSSYAYVADNGYKPEEILSAERFLLEVLSFNVSYPNPMNFLRRISKADNYDLEVRTVAKYLLEISLFDHRMLKFLPSDTAAAAMYLSRIMLGRKFQWDANMVHYSGDCTEEKLSPIVALMVDYLQSPVQHEGFFKKYASKRFMKASIIARSWAKTHANEYPILASSDA